MITFGGIDVILGAARETDALRRAVASVLAVPAERVAVIEDIGAYPPAALADVVLVVTRQLVSIQTEPRHLAYPTEDELLARLAAELDGELLAPEEGANPYLVRRFRPGEAPSIVSLDPVAYDDARYGVRD